MSKKRRAFSAEFTAKVGLEALKGIEPIHVIAQRHEVHPVQVSQWKKEVSERLPEVFAKPSAQVRDEIERNRKEKELYARIGQLQMEREWLKKKLAHVGSKERRSMIETEHPKLSVARQCELLELPRSTYYHHPKPPKEADLALMKQIDESYLESPFFGSRQMTRWLQREGHVVNRKRVRRLMRLMGLTAIYQKPSLSKKAASHQIYPYLLRTLKVERSSQVWATDITYIPVCGGFVYLCAVIDWHSRMVLAWELSNTLDASFCVRAVQCAMAIYGKPEIFNPDQGCQFTSAEFTQPLLAAGVRLSMDGKGRCLDNVLVERLWRSVKYEEVYLKRYETMVEAHANLETYLLFYHDRRPHSAHGRQTPSEVYHAQLDQAAA
ncbi:MAG: IS3 family transposase [Candidatus Synoicihabitans palmerolidicus]|nr:IS3 family transposase [Candidatus Synoicihabitans palmerolidicus]